MLQLTFGAKTVYCVGANFSPSKSGITQSEIVSSWSLNDYTSERFVLFQRQGHDSFMRAPLLSTHREGAKHLMLSVLTSFNKEYLLT